MFAVHVVELTRDTARWLARPPAWPLPKAVLSLNDRARDWRTETRDLDVGLGQFLASRFALCHRWWTLARAIMDQAYKVDAKLVVAAKHLLHHLRDEEYYAIRHKLLPPPTAQGHRIMTAVQRTLLYRQWFHVIWMHGVVVRLEASAAGMGSPETIPACELPYILRLGEATARLLAPKIESPLAQYSLADMDLILVSYASTLHAHGLPASSTVARLDDATECWDVLCTRLAAILAGDLTDRERASRLFFPSEQPFTEPADAMEPADVRTGRLVEALPMVCGNKRLRIGYIERLEIDYYAIQRRFEALRVFVAASSEDRAVRYAGRMARTLVEAVVAQGQTTSAAFTNALVRWDKPAKHGGLGATADVGLRNRVAQGLGGVHVWPGDNERFYSYELQRDPETPVMYEPPFGEEVVEKFRPADYDTLRLYHKVKEGYLARIQRDYMGKDVAAIPVLKIERMAWLYLFTMLDHGFSVLGHGVPHLPSEVVWWDECEQYKCGATVLPPMSPEALWTLVRKRTCTRDQPLGLRACFLRLMRRHFLVYTMGLPVMQDGVPVFPLMTLALPDHPVDALVCWIGACHPSLYPLQRIPAEWQSFVQHLRHGV